MKPRFLSENAWCGRTICQVGAHLTLLPQGEIMHQMVRAHQIQVGARLMLGAVAPMSSVFCF